MRGSEFQTTAEKLANGNSEGDWRSAISRAYYAVFHHFREWLLGHGLDVGKGGQSHFNLYTGLMNCGIATIKPLASRVDELRFNRVSADYELMRQVRQSDASKWVREGKAIVVDFQAILGVVPAAQIVQGARQHLQAIGRLGKTP